MKQYVRAVVIPPNETKAFGWIKPLNLILDVPSFTIVFFHLTSPHESQLLLTVIYKPKVN